MVTSIVSSITTIPVRRDVAMTGEVTLTGTSFTNWWIKRKTSSSSQSRN